MSVPVDCPALEPTERAAVLAYTGRLRDVDPSSSREASSVVRRPWGSYQSVDVGQHHQVKRIVVDPGHRLSLQRHRARAEHWVVVQGTASIVRGEESGVLHENESVFIPVGCAHRLENPGSTPLHLVEVQVGAYLGEDDIERLADDYGRS
jgi:mannose-6-phosphate isomerase-like protein (cupin superfamily)